MTDATEPRACRAEDKIRTIRFPRGGVFIVIFLPVMIIAPVLHPTSPMVWFTVALAFVVIAAIVRQSWTSYYITPDGIVERIPFHSRTMPWASVEAVGKEVHRQRGVIEWITIHVYAEMTSFRIRLKEGPAEKCIEHFVRNCPQAIWIDEARGLFDIPESKDDEHLRKVVRRHAARLRRSHAMAVMASLLVFVPLVVFRAVGGLPDGEEWALWLICFGAFVGLAFQSSAALWRLRP